MKRQTLVLDRSSVRKTTYLSQQIVQHLREGSNSLALFTDWDGELLTPTEDAVTQRKELFERQLPNKTQNVWDGSVSQAGRSYQVDQTLEMFDQLGGQGG